MKSVCAFIVGLFIAVSAQAQSVKPPKENALERFLRYVKIDTQSQEDQATVPSTRKQLNLANLLAKPNPSGPLAFLAPKWEEIRHELQQDLVHRSTKGKQIIATRSGHFIHHEPELVVDAIREVLDAAGNH